MKAKPIAVILTDTHLKESNIAVNHSVYRQARLKAKELGLNVIYHGGDIFESRKGQSQYVLNAFKDVLDEFQHNDMKLIAIPGNHDKTDYGSQDSFLDPFSEHPAFTLFKNHSGTWIESAPKYWIHFMPFFSDDRYIEEFNPNLLTRGKNILLTHIGINGVMMNNGTKVESKVTADLFDKFDRVLIGHYHDASDYNEKIRYIGSSIQHNFGETPNKGLTLLYDDLSVETVPLDFPKYLTFEVDVKDMRVKDIEDFKKEKEETGNQYRIVLTGNEAKIKAYDKQALQDAGIKVAVKQEIIEAEEIDERIEPFTDKTILEAFKGFCEKNNLNLEQGSKYLKQALK